MMVSAAFKIAVVLPDWIRRALRLAVVCLLTYSGGGLAETAAPGLPLIIEPAGLKALLARPDMGLLLVDVRDFESYQLGHLPGAINLPIETTFNQHGDHSRIASLQQVRDVLSNAGIHNSDYLVLYDDGMLKDAAHVFWVLETYGHKHLSVLDGGIAGWMAQDGAIDRIERQLPKSQYLPSIATHHLSTELATLLATHNPHVAIIDARDNQEYIGVTSKARRKGHIPNAISIPWHENLTQTANPAMKSRQELEALYSGLDKKEQVITYCNRGKESAVTYLVLRNLGLNVSIYDGAWLEWGNDDQLPIETGTATSRNASHAK